MAARRSARNSPCASQSAGGGQRGNPRRGFPLCGRPRRPQPARFADARSYPVPGRGWNPAPTGGLWNVVRSAVDEEKGRRGRRPLRVATRSGRVPQNYPGAGRGVGTGENAATGGVLISFAGRRGRRPLQGWCGDVGSAVDSRRAGVEPRPYEGAAERGGVGGDRDGGTSRTPSPTGFLHILGFRENIRLRSCSGHK